MRNIFCALAILLILSQVSCLPPIHELSLNAPQTYISSPENGNWTFFRFNMTKVIPDEDLAVIVRPGDFKSDPDVFISESAEYPSMQNNDEACFQYGYDVCYIEKEKLRENKTFHIGVNCPQGTCKFHIVVKYTMENILTFNQTFEYYYREKGDEVFKFTVPDDPSIEHISLNLEINRGFLIDEDVKMYVAQGNDPASTSSSLPVFVTEYGQIFTAFRGMNFFCTGCNYTLFIEAPMHAVIMLTAKSSNIVYDIHMGRKYFDAMYRGMNFTYLLNTSQEDIAKTSNGGLNESLYFHLITSHGDPDMYVTCGKGPHKNLSVYRWKTEGKGVETLFISREEFQKEFNGSSCEIITVTVYAKVCSAYGLLVNKVNNGLMGIRPGVVETGYVLIGESVNYILTLNNEKSLDLTISLYASDGNPDLLIRGCGNSLDFDSCVISQEMIKNKTALKEDKSRGFFFDYSDLMGNDLLRLRHDSIGCKGGKNDSKSAFCTYLIAVYANKTYTTNDRTEFRLLASIDNKHSYLQEQTPVKSTIDVEEYDYYRFTLLNAEDVLSVNFQVTILSGRPDLFSSRTELYPGFGKYEKAACFCQNLISYSSKDSLDSPLNATYYISVYGMTMSTYTINVLIERNGGENHVIKLFDSLPQKYVMPVTQKYAYFEFSVPSIKEPIDIMLTPLKGNFKFYVNEKTKEDEFPSESNHKWTSHFQSHLLIRPEKVISNSFVVSVKPTYQEPDSDNYQFSILFSSSNKVVSLQPGQPFNAMVSKNDTVFFQFSVDTNVSEITLSQTSARDLVHMMLSTDNEDPFPEKSNISNFNTTSHFITLGKEVFKKECEDFEQKGICYFYGALRSESDKLTHAGLLLDVKLKAKEQVNYIWINDGTFMNLPLPEAGEVRRFVAQLSLSSVTVVDVATLDGQIDIMANIIDTGKHKLSSEWAFPDVSNSSPAPFFSAHSYFNTRSLKFSKENFTQCNPNCLVAFLLVVHNNTGIKYGRDPSFTIQVTSQVITIEEDQNLIGEVHPDTINYYRFFNKHENSSIYITVTPLNPGDPDLVVKKGENERPTLDDYTWVSRKLASDQIEISWANSKDKLGGSMIGFYIIGVIGGSRKKLTYQLSCSSGEVKFLELQDSFPTDVTVEENKWVYLLYKKKSQFIQKINLVILRIYGKGEFFVKKYLLNENPTQNLPSEFNQDITQKTSDNFNSDSVLIGKDSPAFCDVCKYVFAFKASKETKFSASLIIPQIVTYLKPGYSLMNTIMSDEIKAYNFMLNSEKDVEISLSILSGNPSVRAELLPANSSIPAVFYSNRGRNTSVILMKIPSSKYPNRTTLQIEVKSDNRIESLVKKEMTFVITVQNYDAMINLKSDFFLKGSISNEERERIYYFLNERSLGGLSGKLSLTMIHDSFQDLSYKDLIELLQIEFFRKFNEDSINMSPIYFSVQEAKGKTVFNIPIIENATIVLRMFKTINSNKTSKFANTTNLFYTLVLNKGSQTPSNIISLPENQEYVQTIEKGQRSMFEYRVPEEGFIFFQLRDCVGQFQLNGTDQLDNLLNERYNIRVQNPVQDNIFGISKVKAGKFYFSLMAYNGSEFQDSYFADKNDQTSLRAIYHLKINYYKKKDEIPYLSVNSGNHGKIQYSFQEREELILLKLMFTNLETDGLIDFNLVDSFRVFYMFSNTTGTLKAMQKCYMSNKTEALLFSESISPKEHVHSLEIDYNLLRKEFLGSNYLFVSLNIQFNYKHKQSGMPDYWDEDLDIPYNVIEIPLNVEFNKASSKWLIILIALLVFASLFGLFIYRRYKKLKQKLIYELTEARAAREYSGTSMEI